MYGFCVILSPYLGSVIDYNTFYFHSEKPDKVDGHLNLRWGGLVQSALSWSIWVHQWGYSNCQQKPQKAQKKSPPYLGEWGATKGGLRWKFGDRPRVEPK